MSAYNVEKSRCGKKEMKKDNKKNKQERERDTHTHTPTHGG